MSIAINRVITKIIECLKQNIRRTNQLQTTIEYKTNEQSTKYLN